MPVGTSSATIQEYVLDGLMSEAGVATSSVKVEEVKKVPVRFQLLMAGKLKAAALPEPFLSLAEQGGAKIVADDTKSKANLSQTVLVLLERLLGPAGGAATGRGPAGRMGHGRRRHQRRPGCVSADARRQGEAARFAGGDVQGQHVPDAPAADSADVDAVLSWMKSKGYLKTDVTYDQITRKLGN